VHAPQLSAAAASGSGVRDDSAAALQLASIGNFIPPYPPCDHRKSW